MAKRGKKPTAPRTQEKSAQDRSAPEKSLAAGRSTDEKRPATRAADPWDLATLPGNPFAAMRHFAEQMDRLFEDFRLGLPFRAPRGPAASRDAGRPGEGLWAPSVEVAERGGKIVIRADLPGLTKNDVKVELHDDRLSIQGERRQERESKDKGVYRSERSYGRFYREIPLPEGTDPEQAKASFRNGVLEVTVPAPPTVKGRRVPITDV